MQISIVLINYHNVGLTTDCLESLQKVTYQKGDLQIIIVDNASRSDSLCEVKSWISSAKNSSIMYFIELGENRGFSGGNNIGIEKALEDGSEYIILLNNDTLVDSEFLNNLIQTAETDSRIGIVAPKIYFAGGFEFHKERYSRKERGKVIWYAGGAIDWQNMYVNHRGVDEVDRGQYDNTVETDFASGCCMLVKKEVFENIGLLDDELFLYLEDLDLCLRAKEAGYKLIYEPKAKIWHKNALSTGRPGSELHQYYQTRNRLIMGMRYASSRTKLALLRESFRFLLDGGVKKKAVLDFYFYRWGKMKL